MRFIGIGVLCFALCGCCCLLGSSFAPPPQNHRIVRRSNSRAHSHAVAIHKVPPGFFFVGSIDLGPDEQDLPTLAAYYGADAYSINRKDPFGPCVYMFRASEWRYDAVASLTVRVVAFCCGTPLATPPFIWPRETPGIPKSFRKLPGGDDSLAVRRPSELTNSPFGQMLDDYFHALENLAQTMAIYVEVGALIIDSYPAAPCSER